mmetsp:Transcript_23402/g.79633  ORF Transcript_23402/g.79633 Transcript_23402/m.79633 type:complete len:249 (+) Transcript_23402:1628-2374(+)
MMSPAPATPGSTCHGNGSCSHTLSLRSRSAGSNACFETPPSSTCATPCTASVVLSKKASGSSVSCWMPSSAESSATAIACATSSSEAPSGTRARTTVVTLACTRRRLRRSSSSPPGWGCTSKCRACTVTWVMGTPNACAVSTLMRCFSTSSVDPSRPAFSARSSRDVEFSLTKETAKFTTMAYTASSSSAGPPSAGTAEASARTHPVAASPSVVLFAGHMRQRALPGAAAYVPRMHATHRVEPALAAW